MHWPIAILVIPTLVINWRPRPSQWITRPRNMFWGYVLAILRKWGSLNTCQGFLSWKASRGASFELIKSPTDPQNRWQMIIVGREKWLKIWYFGLKTLKFKTRPSHCLTARDVKSLRVSFKLPSWWSIPLSLGILFLSSHSLGQGNRNLTQTRSRFEFWIQSTTGRSRSEKLRE